MKNTRFWIPAELGFVTEPFFFFGDGSDEGLNMLMGKSRGKVKLNRGHEIIFTCFLGGFAF